ncbi:MAG: hypothetical protein E7456_03430 [Ruminococcaceae bacterium]|nr:hypothetical protein [Oscillospiraceae bacterium]
MLKLMGAIMLTAGAALWGFTGAKSLKDRARILGAVTSSIELMEYELCDRLTPVPELFSMLAVQAPKPADRLFQNAVQRLKEIGAVPFSQLWHEAVQDTPELMLTQEEKLTLYELSFSLGKYDISEQRKAMETAKKQFADYTQKAREERDRNWKAQAFMGVTAGLFAVIILL